MVQNRVGQNFAAKNRAGELQFAQKKNLARFRLAFECWAVGIRVVVELVGLGMVEMTESAKVGFEVGKAEPVAVVFGGTDCSARWNMDSDFGIRFAGSRFDVPVVRAS